MVSLPFGLQRSCAYAANRRLPSVEGRQVLPNVPGSPTSLSRTWLTAPALSRY
jgi:hypothetical protein